MSIKVFISHKMEDGPSALLVKKYLETKLNIQCYVDVLDQHLQRYDGDDLGDYFRNQLARCTHLIAVVSVKTQSSWWVPFEIGIATEKQYPLATYAIHSVSLPDYLKKWPYLESEADLATYAKVAVTTNPEILKEGLEKVAAVRRRTYARAFHRHLKEALGQQLGR